MTLRVKLDALRSSLIVRAVVAFLATGTLAAQTFFTDRSVFLSNTTATNYEESFADWSEGDPLDGHQAEWEAPGAGDFNWILTAPGAGNQFLYSLYQAASTSSPGDELTFTFSGDPVYAFGGDFWGTMFDGFPQQADITFQTSNGDSFTHRVTGRTFLGIVSGVPLSAVTISASSSQPVWPTAGNVIAGGLNPNADLDGDGMSNGAEQLAGTAPADARSVFRVTSVAFDGDHLTVTFPAVAGRIYYLEWSDALQTADWHAADVAPYVCESDGAAQFNLNLDAGLSHRTFRVKVELQQGLSARSRGRTRTYDQSVNSRPLYH